MIKKSGIRASFSETDLFSFNAICFLTVFIHLKFKTLASSSYSRWFSHGMYSFSHRLSVVFFGFLNVFFMARMLSKTEIGIWILFTTVTSVLEMVRAGFIRNPFITHLVDAD